MRARHSLESAPNLLLEASEFGSDTDVILQLMLECVSIGKTIAKEKDARQRS